MKVVLILDISNDMYNELRQVMQEDDIEMDIKLHNNTHMTSPIYCRLFSDIVWNEYLHSVNRRLP